MKIKNLVMILTIAAVAVSWNGFTLRCLEANGWRWS